MLDTVASKMITNETKTIKTPNGLLYVAKANTSEINNDTVIDLGDGIKINTPNFCELSNMSNCSNAAVVQQVNKKHYLRCLK